MQQVEEGEKRGLVFEARKILRELGRGTEWKMMDGVNTDSRREHMKMVCRKGDRGVEEVEGGQDSVCKDKSKWVGKRA
jgi:hypothetical protein